MEPYFVDENEGDAVKYTDSPEFESLKDQIASQLFEINGQVSTLQQFLSTLKSFLESSNINPKAVDKIDKKSVDNIHKTRNLVNEINQLVLRINDLEESTLDMTQVIAREKLSRDVKYSIQEFQNTQLSYTKIIKSINDIAKNKLATENNTALLEEEERDNTQVQQQHAQMIVERDPINNEEFVYQQNLIRQRDEEILNIEQGITELNEIFKDLSTVVQQQGLMVDNIEANIYSTLDNTQLASSELNKAMRYQRRSGKWCLYMLIALSVMLLFMLLMVFI
ncbi:hypothetical protein KAFR_0C05990 [Kazachstania africana CBS 2517]|uniref:t-SNARE coiled-coil homology domain-containing protein n=1 Tax=Kazachstania africana (strain ATCC 22294 / BCRC 22015 / CBS 2517 / CECT 1963 / NBRC 1671 / NRRL Y-8276) TaxID=1071382 RepID=H2AT90_KAZAF|nr:hypothetical protein KAFR_0C05990 [Kazachstania africana CBS 2517]CCF57590.1 hypothetical protein KAFR_0C05990 [Kazachstania africana CBS 2517]